MPQTHALIGYHVGQSNKTPKRSGGFKPKPLNPKPGTRAPNFEVGAVGYCVLLPMVQQGPELRGWAQLMQSRSATMTSKAHTLRLSNEETLGP